VLVKRACASVLEIELRRPRSRLRAVRWWRCRRRTTICSRGDVKFGALGTHVEEAVVGYLDKRIERSDGGGRRAGSKCSGYEALRRRR